MSFKPGDLVGIPFPHSDLTTAKRRPVLVVTAPDRHGDFMGLAVNSVLTRESAVSIDSVDMSIGTLPKKSWIRYDKLFTLQSKIIAKTYGSLRRESFNSVMESLCAYLGCSSLGNDEDVLNVENNITGSEQTPNNLGN